MCAPVEPLMDALTPPMSEVLGKMGCCERWGCMAWAAQLGGQRVSSVVQGATYDELWFCERVVNVHSSLGDTYRTLIQARCRAAL